jgi:glucosamine--fructose-6-phosphate aminotransferase (isomerizing)
LDCKSEIAVVHNGIIENYLEIKKELESNGHKFLSRTDTEVVPHLVEQYTSDGLNLEDAFRKVVRRLEGAYSLVLVATQEPHSILCARKESPLVLGLGDREYYCASDISAFLPITKKAVLLDEGELAYLTRDGYRIFKTDNGGLIKRDPITVTWDPESAKKGGFKHFMLKEIHEQPQTVRNALQTPQIYHDLIASRIADADRVFIVACGTSSHAGLVGSYALRRLAGIDARVVVASEFAEDALELVDRDTAVLAISQSGETMDTLNAVRDAKARGARILSVTNVLGSTLMRLSDVYIGQNSGPEIGVAGTKTFTSQVAVLLRLGLTIGNKNNTNSDAIAQQIEEGLKQTPTVIQDILNTKLDSIRRTAESCEDSKSVCFLGRGVNVATAMEGRLKLLELSYIPAIAYPAGESKHGFISVVEDGFPVVFVAPPDETHRKIVGNIMEMKARGARIISIIQEGDIEIKELSDDSVEIPGNLPSLVTPIAYAVPLQLFAYYASAGKGYDPDYPRNLAKSVTVE